MGIIAYTGIGSRETPAEILVKFEELGCELARRKLVLRSGGADGADTAFEEGCDRGHGIKEIYLPWPGFNGRKSLLNSSPAEAFDIAAKFHPFWLSLKRPVQRLHARNVQQVLGRDLDHVSIFVICYTNPNKGGTTQALRIAGKNEVPIYNFWNDKSWDIDELLEPFAELLEGR